MFKQVTPAARTIVLVCGLTLPPLALHAQRPGERTVTRADASVGDLDALERARYEDVRRAPRSAEARAALGLWLASRGQLRSGAVLLEEARLFGGDARSMAARLAPIYEWLRDWESLAALPSSPLGAGERGVAARLAEQGSVADGADSTTVAFAPLELGALGRIPLRLGNDTVWADVDPQETGFVLAGLGRGAGLVQVLGEGRRGLVGILSECALGDITLRRVPVRIDTTLGAGRARMGFDWFARLAPTVDARAGTVTLRRAGRVGAGSDGVPMLLDFPGVRLAARAGEAPVPMGTPAGRAALRGRPWTVDLRRGTIWREAAPER